MSEHHYRINRQTDIIKQKYALPLYSKEVNFEFIILHFLEFYIAACIL